MHCICSEELLSKTTNRAGVELIRQAIALNANVAAAHNDRGAALTELKRPEEALASYDKAIALKPDFAEAFNNRGNALRELKRCGSTGELRQGDRAQARLCRGVQQPRQCADRAEPSRGGTGELRQGDRADARPLQRLQQPWQCADWS